LLVNTSNRMVEFEAGSKQARGYLAVPSHPKGAVLVLHAWWGLNDFFKGYADRLASQGYLAFAPDLYDGPVAKTVEEAKVLHSEKEKDDVRMKTIILGAEEFLRSNPSVSGRKIGVIGFSMGAAWSYLLSTMKPESVGAVVVFYGAWPTDFSKAKAAFLGHFSPDDEWEPIDGIKATESKLREAGRDVEFHFYPGTKHWFVEENRPVEYNRDAADLAWKRTIAFLDNKLR
jgi:carboxymethylenebutenolidase